MVAAGANGPTLRQGQENSLLAYPVRVSRKGVTWEFSCPEFPDNFQRRRKRMRSSSGPDNGLGNISPIGRRDNDNFEEDNGRSGNHPR
jgi:hypothetical protein